MPIFNYDVTSRPLSVGTAFELHLDGVPIRRGITLDYFFFWYVSCRGLKGLKERLFEVLQIIHEAW